MSTRPPPEVAAGVQQMIRALGTRIGAENPEDLLNLLMLASEIDTQLARAVEGLRSHGITDGDIAKVLGVTRQAVSKRWPDGGRRKGAAGRYPAGPGDRP